MTQFRTTLTTLVAFWRLPKPVRAEFRKYGLQRDAALVARFADHVEHVGATMAAWGVKFHAPPIELTEREFCRLVARSRQRCPVTGRFVQGGAV